MGSQNEIWKHVLVVEVTRWWLFKGFDIFTVGLSGGESMLEFAPSDNPSHMTL